MSNKTIINLPGCPPNPYTLLGVVLQYADSGTLPEMDAEKRPKFAYDRDIHEHCPRRAHFDAGHFVKQYGDEGHREGWCLYEMGCKGPDTHAGCSTRHFNEIPDVWPIGIGAPCIGCTEKSIAFRVPMFKVVQIHTLAAPPTTYAPISAPQGIISPRATGVVGVAAGALAGAGYIASRKFSTVKDDESTPGASSAAGKGQPGGESPPERRADPAPDSGPVRIQRTRHESRRHHRCAALPARWLTLAGPQEGNAACFARACLHGMSQAERHDHRSSGLCQVGAWGLGLHRLPHRWGQQVSSRKQSRSHARLYRLSQRTVVSRHRLRQDRIGGQGERACHHGRPGISLRELPLAA